MSTLNVSNITDGTTTVGTSYVVNGSAKAWVNFNAQTPAIRDSFNSSSLTDNGTGQYYTNWSSSMSSGDYAANVSASDLFYGTSAYFRSSTSRNLTSSSAYMGTRRNVGDNTPALGDPFEQTISVHGDLA